MNVVEKTLLERIRENEKVFSKDEIIFIEKNIKIVEKIYILGALDMN